MKPIVINPVLPLLKHLYLSFHPLLAIALSSEFLDLKNCIVLISASIPAWNNVCHTVNVKTKCFYIDEYRNNCMSE